MNKKREIKVGNRMIGDGHSNFITAEIGINHNGSIDIAKKLIDGAKLAGCDAVKFQKRSPELCVPKDLPCRVGIQDRVLGFNGTLYGHDPDHGRNLELLQHGNQVGHFLAHELFPEFEELLGRVRPEDRRVPQLDHGGKEIAILHGAPSRVFPLPTVHKATTGQSSSPNAKAKSSNSSPAG